MTVGMPNKFVSTEIVFVLAEPVPVPATLAFDADSAFIAASLWAELIASPTVSAVSQQSRNFRCRSVPRLALHLAYRALFRVALALQLDEPMAHDRRLGKHTNRHFEVVVEHHVGEFGRFGGILMRNATFTLVAFRTAASIFSSSLASCACH